MTSRRVRSRGIRAADAPLTRSGAAPTQPGRGPDCRSAKGASRSLQPDPAHHQQRALTTVTPLAPPARTGHRGACRTPSGSHLAVLVPSTIRDSMDATEVAAYICETFPGVETTEAYGYTFFFYGSERMLPFATLAHADNEHDRVSDLDRDGAY